MDSAKSASVFAASGFAAARAAAARTASPWGSPRRRSSRLASAVGANSASVKRSAAPTASQTFGVGGLVIVGGRRERDEDGGATGDLQFCDGRGAGARDDEMRCAQALAHVGEKGGDFSVDAGALVDLAHLGDLLLADLMDDPQPSAQRLGSMAMASGMTSPNRRAPWLPPMISKCSSPPAGASGYGRSRTARIGSRTGLPTTRLSEAARSRKPIETLKAAGDDLGACGHGAIDPPEHGILLVNENGRLPCARGHERWEGGITAKAGDERRRRFGEAALGGVDAAPDLEQRRNNGDGIGRERRSGDIFDALGGKPFRVAAPARVGHQKHPPAAAEHLFRERRRWKQMSPGSARGDDDDLFGHCPNRAYCAHRDRRRGGRGEATNKNRTPAPNQSWKSRRTK